MDLSEEGRRSDGHSGVKQVRGWVCGVFRGQAGKGLSCGVTRGQAGKGLGVRGDQGSSR